MNADKQRIAIARACGWENSQTDSKTCYNPHGEHCYWSVAPNYLNDLNAMHEAENGLSPEQQNAYVFKLNLMVESGKGFWPLTHATAAQRAEAFLKTLGKWEDDK